MGIRVVIYSLPFEVERFFLFIALQKASILCKGGAGFCLLQQSQRKRVSGIVFSSPPF